MRSVAERKYWDNAVGFNVVLGGPPITTTGGLFLITGVPQDNTVLGRIGDKMTGTSIEVNFSMYAPNPAGTYDPLEQWWFRMTIFIWKDDSAPVEADITEQAYAITQNVLTPIAPLNHDRKIKRKILYDKVFSGIRAFFGVDAYTVWTPIVTKRFAIPLTKLGKLSTVNFLSGSNNAINHIYVLLTSNCPPAVAPTSAWVIELYTRYNFIDM